nr:uncharacterized protein LOC106692901 [Halyomorpha halys]
MSSRRGNTSKKKEDMEDRNRRPADRGTMVRKVGKHHYLASHNGGSLGYIPGHHYRGYSIIGEESQRSMTERRERRRRSRSAAASLTGLSDNEAGSDIYITSPAYRAPSEYSRGSRAYSYRSRPPSGMSGATVKSKIDRKRGVVVETMSAPNPFCPNTKGLCCLMLLLNLALILITLGFVIVIQFFEPFFVWILGIVFLIFGFLTLVGSLIYCVTVCKDVKSPSEVARGEHYWTHHWRGTMGTVPPHEIHYRHDDKYATDTDAYSVSEKHVRPNSRY